MIGNGTLDSTVGFLVRHPWKIILGFLAFTLIATIPLLVMGATEDASSEPGGEVFDLWHDIEEQFPSPRFANPYLVESRSGDMLTQEALSELYQNQRKLLEADRNGDLRPSILPAQPFLYEALDPVTERPFTGLYSVADAVQELLTSDPSFATNLDDATDEQVKLAVHHLLEDPATEGLRESFSVKATSERRVISGQEIDFWIVPAFVFTVVADNQKLGGGISSRSISGDDSALNKEAFSRNVQRVLRGDQRTYLLWGIAIDLNLESEDEGLLAGKFVMFTVVAAVAVVGLSLRSYWATALTGAGLCILMIWLKGFSNLIGIKGGLIIELIVPIAMISLGVDFAIHALHRYQEERGAGNASLTALRVGLVGVLGALVLAMLSDNVAFLANTASGIESVIHFGIAAAIAVTSAFIVLGVILPLVMMQLDRLERPGLDPPSALVRSLILVGGAAVAVLSGASIIFLVAVDVALGLTLSLVTVGVFVGLPALVMWRRKSPEKSQGTLKTARASPTEMQKRYDGGLVAVVTQLARRRRVVLPITVALTGAALVLSLRLEPSFDVRDFFDTGSDFVVSLDKLGEHVGRRGGEPAVIYVKGDLTDPESLASLQRFLGVLSDNPYSAKRDDGHVDVWSPNLLSILQALTTRDYPRDRIAAVTGIELSDANNDGLPDSRSQIAAAYDYAILEGVPLDHNTQLYTSAEVKSVLIHNPEVVGEDVAVMSVGVPSSRDHSLVRAAREALERDLQELEPSPSIDGYGVTGSLFIREGQLDAATKTLQTSLPIAAAGTLVLLIVATRSLRYAVVTAIPIGLVVVWLYAFMYLTGFALNFVTATIGAISVGVGIDYSVHMTQRFREELARVPDKLEALRRATRGTGVALLASAASSILGFLIMGLAPMPLFSSYGLLTAAMIFLALIAALAVLPSLLLLVAPGPDQEGHQA